MCVLSCLRSLICILYFLQYSDTVGWVFWPVKTVGRITYIVLAQTLNHAQSTYARFRYIVLFRVAPKMAQFMLNLLTSSNINRFSKFFHCKNQEKICNNILTKDPTTPQVCRYTTLSNARKSWFRLTCQEWRRLASSSSSREPRLAANITVNMFSVAVYYLTSVQDASATPRPCSRTAHRHTLDAVWGALRQMACMRRPAARQTHWTFDVKTAWCDSYCRQ